MRTIPWWFRWERSRLQRQRPRFDWEDPLEEGMAAHSSGLPGEPHGQRGLVGCNPWGRRESDTNKHSTVNCWV